MMVKGRPVKITRNNIANKSLELYWKNGIQNTTYNTVINYSGYSKTTVYNLFKSEDDLQAKTLEYYFENDLINIKKYISKYNDLLDFINFIFENKFNSACYFLISNSNKHLLGSLSKATLIKLEKEFKKLLTVLIVKHINKHKLNVKNSDISSLMTYLFHNFTLLNIMKNNKSDKKDFKIIKNAITEKILTTLHNQ